MRISRPTTRTGRTATLGCFLLNAAIWGCGEKFPLPSANVAQSGQDVIGDTLYVQQAPVWGQRQGYDFKAPQDVLVGSEPLVYVADTGNDRIVMLDPVGTVLGVSPPIPHPAGLAQDDRLNLLVVNNTNRVYKIRLVEARHLIGSARIDTILTITQRDNPQWRFTAITAYLGRKYYVTRTGPATNDNAIVQFTENDEYGGPLPLVPGGTGFYSVTQPSGITQVRKGTIDFIFTQTGDNFYKAQWITTDQYGFLPKIDEGKAFFTPEQFEAPEDVALDDVGNIYVIDAGAHRLRKYNPAGGEFGSQGFGELGNGERQFNAPHGVAWFAKVLYVADTGNNRIVRFKLNTDL